MGTALVTGATTGIGEEFCWQLASAGHDLVLVARSQDKLEALAHRLYQASGVHTEVIVADLTCAQDRARVAERIDTDSPRPIGLLVNNAGMALGQTFIDGTLEREEYALELMVTAVLSLSWAAAKAMTRRGHGAILNVSSMASRAVYGTYAAHKAWVRSFTEGLQVELAGTRVTATALMPGLVHTEFYERVGVDDTVWPDVLSIPVERVVADALQAVRRGRAEVVPMVPYWLLDQVFHHVPRPLIRWCMEKVRRGKNAVVV